MRRVRQAIVVEGKHDAIRVRSAVDAVVVCTDGFGIFKNDERMALLRRLAATRGLIVLTDSDSAGGVIRNYLLGAIPQEQLTVGIANDNISVTVITVDRNGRTPGIEIHCLFPYRVACFCIQCNQLTIPKTGTTSHCVNNKAF